MELFTRSLGFLLVLNVMYCSCTELMEADVPSTTRSLSLAEQLERDKIIPDLLEKAPSEAARVNYSSGIVISPGDEVSGIHVSDMPYIWWNGTENNYYTIIFVDIDHPSRVNPENRSLLVWLVANILGDSQSGGDIIAPYVPPKPDINTGLHRFVFLIYQQPEPIRVKEDRSLHSNRAKFSPSNFAEEFNLSSPIATNYFLLEFENKLPDNVLRMLNNKKKNSAPIFKNNMFHRSLCVAGYGILSRIVKGI